MNPIMRSLRQANRAQNAHQAAMAQLNKEIAITVPWAKIVFASTPRGIYHVVISNSMGELYSMPVTDFMKLIHDGVVSRDEFFSNAEVLGERVCKELERVCEELDLTSEKLEASGD